MTDIASPEIRHMAIVVADVDRSATFYQAAFGLVLIERGSTPRAEYAYLSDGELNLAILHYISDQMAGVENSGSFVGAHHFGFQVSDLKASQQRAEDIGGRFHFNLGDEKKGNFESKYRDPNGVIFDISHGGWTGTPTQRVGERHDVSAAKVSGVARLKHLALTVPDPETSAGYFADLFDLKRERGGDIPALSDGYVSLQFLRSPSASTYVGAHAIGFEVSDLDVAELRLLTAGGRMAEDGGAGRYLDPDNIPVIMFTASMSPLGIGR